MIRKIRLLTLWFCVATVDRSLRLAVSPDNRWLITGSEDRTV
jgi:WD40 repeat protein